MLRDKSDDGGAFIGVHCAVWKASVNRDESKRRQPAQQSSRRADRKRSSLYCTPVKCPRFLLDLPSHFHIALSKSSCIW